MAVPKQRRKRRYTKDKRFCDKEVYATEQEAVDAMKAWQMMASYDRVAPPTCYYPCPKCGFYHLTTK